MLRSLPVAARALLWVRTLNALGAYALSFLAVLAGPGLAAVALASFGVTALVSRWAGAFLLGRFSPRAVLTAGLTATGLSLLLLVLARGPAQVLAAIALVGLAFELYEPASQELVARAATGERRHATYAAMGVALSAAGAAAGLLATVLLPLGVRWLVTADALTCLTAAALAAKLLPHDPPHPTLERERPQRRSHPGPRRPEDQGRTTGERWRAARELRRTIGGRWRTAGEQRSTVGEQRGTAGERRVVGERWRPPGVLVRLTVASTAFAIGYLALMMYLPLALLERGAPAWVPGLTLASTAAVAPLTLWASRRLVRGRSHGAILAMGTLVLGVLALVMAITGSVPITVAAGLGCAVVDSVLLGRWQSLVADAAPEGDRPRWFAFQGSSWGVAQPAVPPLAALAGTAAGGPGAGAGAGAFLAAGVAFLLVPLVLRRLSA